MLTSTNSEYYEGRNAKKNKNKQQEAIEDESVEDKAHKLDEYIFISAFSHLIREFFGFKKQKNKQKMDIEKQVSKQNIVEEDDEEIARKLQE